MKWPTNLVRGAKLTNMMYVTYKQTFGDKKVFVLQECSINIWLYLWTQTNFTMQAVSLKIFIETSSFHHRQQVGVYWGWRSGLLYTGSCERNSITWLTPGVSFSSYDKELWIVVEYEISWALYFLLLYIEYIMRYIYSTWQCGIVSQSIGWYGSQKYGMSGAAMRSGTRE